MIEAILFFILFVVVGMAIVGLFFKVMFSIFDWFWDHSLWYILTAPFLFTFGFICGLFRIGPGKVKPKYRYNHSTQSPDRIA